MKDNNMTLLLSQCHRIGKFLNKWGTRVPSERIVLITTNWLKYPNAGKQIQTSGTHNIPGYK